MKNLSTLIKLSTLLIIGGGTVGAAVGVTEAQMRNNGIVENDEFVHADFNEPNLGKHARIYIQIPNRYTEANAYMKFMFANRDSWNWTEKTFMRDKEDPKLYYCDTKGTFDYNVFQVKRLNPNNHDQQWAYFEHFIDNTDCNYFECGDVINEQWGSITVVEKYAIEETDLIESTEVNNLNRNEYHDVFLNRNGHWNNDGDMTFLQIYNKSGYNKVIKPSAGYPTIKTGAGKLWLAHFTAPTKDLVNSTVRCLVWNIDNVQKKNAGLNIIFPSARTSILKIDETNLNQMLSSKYEGDNFNLSVRNLLDNELPESALIKEIFEGLDSCSANNINGINALKNLDKTWKLSSVKDVMKATTITDYEKMLESDDGTKTPVGTDTFTCLYKYENMLGLPNTVFKSNNLSNLISNSTIAIVSVSMLSVATIGCFFFLNKKRKALTK